MSSVELPFTGLLLDASALRQYKEVLPVYQLARQLRLSVHVSASVYAEMQRGERAWRGPNFRQAVVDKYLELSGITVLPFTREDGDALVRWTDDALGGDSSDDRERAWQLWKMRKAASGLRPVVRHALRHLAVEVNPDALAPALEHGAHAAIDDDERFPGTLDWLMLGIAHRWNLAIVTEENPARQLSEFQYFTPCYRLEEAVKLLSEGL